MKTKLVPSRFGVALLSFVAAGGLLVGCGTEPRGDAASGEAGSTGEGGSGGGQGGFGGSGGEAPVTCTPNVEIASNTRSLMITDPAILAKFSLERVLQQMISKTDDPTGASVTPLEFLQRMFDSENTAAAGVFADVAHCDQFNFAFMNAPAMDCPRAEGALATNPNLFTEGDPNSFVPVAIVNRLDLMRKSAVTCGEYRIVYAKQSGKTNPEDRLFIIIEASLTNPLESDVMSCKPVADMWASLEKEADLQVVSDKIENFFFTGLNGFGPVVHPDNCGDKSPDDDGSYGGSRGQVRIGQKMQTRWEWREFHIKRTMGGTTPLAFVPVSVKNNPMPERFDVEATPGDDWFRQEFLWNSVQTLAAPTLGEMRMQAPGKSNMGQSVFEGTAASDYATRGSKSPGSDFASQIESNFITVGVDPACANGDTLTGKNILQRASVQTCAGCHAPQKVLEPGNALGCGLTFPDSLGEVHIDENSKLSPALTDVFLPARAKVLSTFVGGCSAEAIRNVLAPSDAGDGNGIPK